MNKVVVTVLGAFFLFINIPSFAADRGTADEAVAMVKKAKVYWQQNGQERVFKAFSDPKGSFVDRDLYITVYDYEGNNYAHGASPKIIGKNMIELRDVDGVQHIKQRIELAKKQSSGWHEFKYVNPVSKKIEPKRMYFERMDKYIVSCGIYKENT